MFESANYNGTRVENYKLLYKQIKSVTADEPELTSNLANISALLNEFFDRINWVGFYLMNNDELILGPFQGKVACTRIAVGKGVCGTAVEQDKTQLVMNVHEFPGHIACDSASNSEIVVPIHSKGKTVGVLDMDSPEFSRFDETDKENLEIIAELIGRLF